MRRGTYLDNKGDVHTWTWRETPTKGTDAVAADPNKATRVTDATGNMQVFFFPSFSSSRSKQPAAEIADAVTRSGLVWSYMGSGSVRNERDGFTQRAQSSTEQSEQIRTGLEHLMEESKPKFKFRQETSNGNRGPGYKTTSLRASKQTNV